MPPSLWLKKQSCGNWSLPNSSRQDKRSDPCEKVCLRRTGWGLTSLPLTDSGGLKLAIPDYTEVARPEDLRQAGNAGPEYQPSRLSTDKTLPVKTVSGRDASNITAKVQVLVWQLQTSKVLTLY